MPPIGVIMRSHNTQYHIYADETQEYISSDLKSLLLMLTISICAFLMLEHK